MKKVLSFDVDQTLNVAKTPITEEMARVLIACLEKYKIAPISGQKFDQFLIQIIDPMKAAGVSDEQLLNMHLFVTQGTRYYRYNLEKKDWDLIYKYDLTPEQVAKMTEALEQAAKELKYWVELDNGDEIIENRVSQVTYSALGQKAGTEEKYAWDPDHKKRQAIVARAKELTPEFEYEIGGTTSINAALPGTNKKFGMTHLLEELAVKMEDVLYFGDMTQPGGNDFPVVEMGFDTITVRDWEETANVLRGVLYTD
jgi:HAD superfamily hydrolase (TIGR01484 family)